MGAIKVPTNFNIELEFEIPEFYRRMLALIIDITLEFFYLKIAFGILENAYGNDIFLDSEAQYDKQAWSMILFVPIMIYHVTLETLMNGQSVGKKIMSLRVVDELGGKPSISQFIIRWLLRVSDVWVALIILILLYYPSAVRDSATAVVIFAALAFLIVDLVLVVSSKKGQRIGDKLAHTILIRTNTKSNIEETVFQEVADSYVPSFPQIMQLSDKDINAIKSILETARKKGDFYMASNASEKIKTHLKIDSNLSPFDFLDTLLKDYNYLSVK